MSLSSLLFDNPLLFAMYAASFVIALSVHEWAHAWSADRLGDPTPRYKGRITLDPRAHLDPLGTIALLFVGFGWGKPVEVDPYNFKEPQRDMALVAAAGPASNIALALLSIIAINLAAFFSLPVVIPFFQIFIILNVMLAIFNLVPVAPLDGSKILPAFLPKSTALEYEQFMHRYGFILLLMLLIPINGGSTIGKIISPVIDLTISALNLLIFI